MNSRWRVAVFSACSLLPACSLTDTFPASLASIEDSRVMHDSLARFVVVGEPVGTASERLKKMGFVCQGEPVASARDGDGAFRSSTDCLAEVAQPPKKIWSVTIADSGGRVQNFRTARLTEIPVAK